ncbi:magnesium protoporphyrin O-methyltransferase, bchM [Lactococcus cremoris]|jgi:ubiquinone/menaquinone biosynthesis C-methylase UbiE|uniref:SAM-dependent methyltransferase n=5 Tax=Lactococcus lactis subsp. cremoris TaxID=1359 RepID=A0A084AAI6_LACLC|nr:SAM-dependent methyltransferase [Lactococcus cremoris subsp. cremoris SK11]AGV72209.1 SAM-dependent methyltransferase [Lactococcus cremoris subsp. cremoris KW2]KEY62315.1 SAM-dependent methyltransferase [Lactococcus cremoris subsp. cremoris GE214]KKW70130.1 magnesium protoporphyrin O-methyltransferase, bchM [Lactococcus cremoris]KKW70623.1 magnesium protoporphyrin O-methyltransferase, bchM [Lactococcus cremoris]
MALSVLLTELLFIFYPLTVRQKGLSLIQERAEMAFYEDFSRVYDQVMDQELYEQWLDFTKRHLPKETKSVFELACGSGALSVRLAQEGYEVTGLDISEEMLTLASKKARQAGYKLEFTAGDMRDLSGLGKFDAVTCYSDSLCYLENLNEVQATFDGVFEILNEGGTFIFDVHSTHQVDEVFPNYSYHENAEDFAFLWDSFEGEVPHSIVHELSFFIQGEDGRFTRKDEVHEERTYPIDDYLAHLATAGFKEAIVCADFTDEAPSKESARWFFVCKK